jgi:hypothetical protein
MSTTSITLSTYPSRLGAPPVTRNHINNGNSSVHNQHPTNNALKLSQSREIERGNQYNIANEIKDKHDMESEMPYRLVYFYRMNMNNSTEKCKIVIKSYFAYSFKGNRWERMEILFLLPNQFVFPPRLCYPSQLLERISLIVAKSPYIRL